MMRKLTLVFSVCFLSVVLFAGFASAHVVVFPKETKQGSYEKFSVRVPSELDGATTAVELKIPADVTISRFEPKPGWEYKITKDASDKIDSVTWVATGQGLSNMEFTEFNMSGKVGDEAAAINWKAYQTYKDGTVVEWIGAEGSDKPAPVTVVSKGTSADDAHGEMAEGSAMESSAGVGADLPLYLSIAALCLGLVSLFISLRQRKK